MNSHTYAQLMFDQSADTIQWRKDSHSDKGAEAFEHPELKKKKEEEE